MGGGAAGKVNTPGSTSPPSSPTALQGQPQNVLSSGATEWEEEMLLKSNRGDRHWCCGWTRRAGFQSPFFS